LGVALVFTDRDSGDFRIDGDPVDLARLRGEHFEGRPWTWLRQVHGAGVVVVEEPGEHAGTEADAAVTAAPGAVLAIHTADCAPLVLVDHRHGVLGVAHVGWRGLVGGVVEATVDAMAGLGAEPASVAAHLGPCIRPGCYEFGTDDLRAVADRYGEAVVATTIWGAPALDVPAGIDVALDRAGVPAATDREGCTACDARRYFSHRARGERGRHAAAAMLT
jgi:YfiH family protein